ncbi:MAG TPA: MFS transporter [Planctomycetota bacterium]|nr:MFS transporter [Planctomycetota bacterium]
MSTGTVGILIGNYLAKVGLTTTEMGVVMGAGLAGNTFNAAVATFYGDRLGRRRLLIALAILMGVGGVLVTMEARIAFLAAAAFIAMTNANGRERGASLILEQSMLPSLTDAANRTRAFAWFNMAGDIGLGVGGLLAMTPAIVQRQVGMGEIRSYQLTLILCACAVLITAPLTAMLSRAVEPTVIQPRLVLAPQSRTLLTRISTLFAIDALGGGFITTAWLTYYFTKTFGVSEVEVGLLFVGARVVNAISHIGAAWIARHIGLVNTMVVTSLPSSGLLLTVLIAPSFPVAALLFLIREGLVQMDVPTRQSYVMACVRPEERTQVSGITHLVRLASWAVAPVIGGWLMSFALATPFFVGAALKVIYAVLLYFACRSIRPPEEEAEPKTADAKPADEDSQMGLAPVVLKG